ncbi:hypothetical protein MCUN1_000389 [Malassezia cuniculi]|uniref:Homeobox domain-containing protein n=1 Tax=Malassezia cuniculi TaxID=948313 RepID=A0AAF0ENH2_9BASI|nr:hypothetical protein MCUN1_000389 [Malassezia cuniculi]
MHQQLDFLQRYVEALDTLHVGFSPTAPSPVGPIQETRLDLRTPSTSLAAALEARPLANDVREALVAMYERISAHLACTFNEHYGDAAQFWAASHHGVVPLLQRLFEAQFQLATQDTHQAILAMVDERLAEFMRDAGNAEDGDSRSRATYAHSEYAVAILERAFEHAPNITQAEKHKLAAATGLQPRQVTIWFQNRRNRRVTRREKSDTRGDSASYTPRTPRLGPVPKRQRRRERTPKPKIEETDDLDMSIESAPSQAAPSESTAEMHEPLETETEIREDDGPFTSLDALLEIDNSKQSLVFSPLDSLPRLDFDDLQLDQSLFARMFETPFRPSRGSYGANHSFPTNPSVPPFMRMLPLGFDAEQAGDELVQQTQQLAESLLCQMRERGLNVPNSSVSIEGVIHSAALCSAALRSAEIHSAVIRTAALRAPWHEAPSAISPNNIENAHSPIARAWFESLARGYTVKHEPTAMPSELLLGAGSKV